TTANAPTGPAPAWAPAAADGPKPAPAVVMVGEWAPQYLAFARRCAALGVPVYFLDTAEAPVAWGRYTACLAGGGRLDPNVIGTDEGVERVLGQVRAFGADALIARNDGRMRWL